MTNSENIDLSKALNDVQDLYDNAPVGYHSIDKTGLITRINNIHLTWLGYTREEVEGKMNVRALLLEDAQKRFEEQLERLKQQGHHENIEIYLKRKDGSIFPVLLNTSVIYDENKQFLSTRTVIWDMTEKKKLEETVRKTSEALFQANQDKTRFIGMASHDLQNPITAISMAVELLQKTGLNLRLCQLIKHHLYEAVYNH